MLAVLLLTQALVFEPVDIEVRDGMRVQAEQGTLVVPLRHAEPNGAVIRLRVVRFAAHPGASGPPLLYLSGGPGDSGVGDLRAFPAPLLDSLRANGDVLALDQRGTGLSEPRVPACPAGPALPLDRPGNPALDLPLFQRHASACVAHWKRQGIDLRAFTTDENADDVEALRRARGGGPIALLAGSYGSHLAFAVVRRHPGSVARIALFGIEGPDQTVKRPALIDEVLVRLGEEIRADSHYDRVLPDPVASVRRLLVSLSASPRRGAIGGDTLVVGEWDLRHRLAEAMGRHGPMRQVPAALVAMERGDFTDLFRWAREWRRGRAWGAMGFTTDCASWASPARLERVRTEAREALVGGAIDFPFPAVCEGLDLPRLGDDFRAALGSSVPALFVTGELDGRTPVANALEMAAGFSESHLLTVEHAGHGIMGYPQLNGTLLAFLRGARELPARASLPPLRFPPP